MPPKKANSPARKDDETVGNSSSNKTGQTKRKRATTPEPSDDDAAKMLRFLLNDAADQFAQGADAKQPNLFDHMQHSANYSPFQNLVASAIMSKPISSRLGARTLRTIFEAPQEESGEGIDYSSPSKMRDAGDEGRYEALSRAKTQHKDKTAAQLGKLAEKVIDEYAADEEDTSLEKMHTQIGGDGSKLAGIVKDFYGMGDTAAEIFQRRMQADWKELYPYADERALNAAAHLRLAHDSPQALANQVESLVPSKQADQLRRNFATIVDALIAVDLEHKYEEVLEAVRASSNITNEHEDDSAPASKQAKRSD